MPSNQSASTHRRSLLWRLVRILLGIILVILLLVVVIVIAIQTPYIQNIVRVKAQNYLAGKLKTKVEIGHLYVGFPHAIQLDKVYLEDRQHDTLAWLGKLRVDLDMWKLIHSEIQISSLALDNVTAKIKRQLPDTSFNFQFIVDAFSDTTAKRPTSASDSSSWKIALNRLSLNNIRLVYNDIVTGNDMEFGIGKAVIKTDTMDLNKMLFSLSTVEIKNVVARVYQQKPLQTPKPVPKTRDTSAPLALSAKDIDIGNISLDYKNTVSALYTFIHLQELKGSLRKFDMLGQLIDLDSLSLNRTNAVVRIGKPETSDIINKKVAPVVDSANAGWRLVAGSIRLSEDSIRYDDDSRPRIKKGLDNAHINAPGIALQVDRLMYGGDTLSGSLVQLKIREQSGLVINNAHGNFFYGPRNAFFKDMRIETPGSLIQRGLMVSYPSIDALQKNPELVKLDVDLKNSHVQTKDILLFAPFLSDQKAFRNPNSVWWINTRLTGSLAKLNIPSLHFHGLSATSVDIAGTIQNATDPNKIYADLDIRQLSTTREDLLSLIPPGQLPSSLNIPEKLSITGKLKGNKQAAAANLQLRSSMGDISLSGSGSAFTDKRNALYDVLLRVKGLALDKLLRDTTLGILTATVRAKGRGYDPQTAEAMAKADVEAVGYNKYTYHNIHLDAKAHAGHVKGLTTVRDPNLSVGIGLEGVFLQSYPAIRATIIVDTLNTLPLHFTTDTVFYRGQLAAYFPVTNPDSLQGNLLVTESLLIQNNRKIPLDTLQVLAGTNDSGQFIHLRSDLVDANLYGKYKLTEMATVFKQSMEPYFSRVPDSAIAKTARYDFNIDASLTNKPVLKVILPDLKEMDSVTLKAHFSSEAGWDATLKAPSFADSSITIKDLQAKVVTQGDALRANISVAEITSGSSLNIYSTTLNASIAHNTIDAVLLNKDKAGKNKYRLGLKLEQPQKGQYALSLKPDSLMLNYDSWNISKDNLIAYDGHGINIHNFELSKEGQLLKINSSSPAPDAPIDIEMKDFRLATISGFVKQDTLFVDGSLEGKAEISDVMTKPVFTSDLTIRNLSMSKDTLGDLHITANNTEPNAYTVNLQLTGRGNDVSAIAKYLSLPGQENTYDVAADIRQLQLKTVEGASQGLIKDASGSINGNIAMKGTTASPSLAGELNFNKARFNLGMFNSYFSIDGQKIVMNNEGLRFNSFTIADSAGNKAVIDGLAKTTDLRHYDFDLTVRARDFHALSTTKKDNKVYYGQLYFNTNLNIKGTEVAPIVDGSLTINGKTNMTVVLPQDEPGIEERNGIVKFVNSNAPPTDFVVVNPEDSLRQTRIKGMELSLNITVEKEAALAMIVDEGNGDILTVKGEANLSASIDPGGRMNLTGSYELEDGSYELTFNMLKRKFKIEKGSKITWKGEATEAEVDITATYISNAAPIDLVKNQLENVSASVRNTYQQKLPFQVNLKMTGALLKPLITFDILLPEDKNYVVSKNIIELINEKLTELRKEPSELNKQVFALLLLNRFVGENPFESSSEGATVESMARASVSKLLTQQLNNLAADLIQGVNINFDVTSQDDYSAGERTTRTDLNVAISKRLLNDRLTVTVGSNFELEGAQTTGQNMANIAGDVAVDYRLSKDGRYLLRVYRRNDYYGLIEGYVIETGIGFIITVDYNKLKEIFRSQKEKDLLRAQREAKRKQQEAEKASKKTIPQ